MAQSDIQALLDTWSEAVRQKDLDRLVSLYASDAVYFDVVPPLQIKGADGIRRNFARWFDMWTSPIGTERRDTKILAGDDVATAFTLHRTSGTLKTGREVNYWLRVTVGCTRSDRGWRIAHEHVSIPIDFASGKVVMDLVP